MFFNPYIIEADQSVKLRFLPLVLNGDDQENILMTLNLAPMGNIFKRYCKQSRQ